MRVEPFHSSSCFPRKAAATCANLMSPSEGTAPVSGCTMYTAPVMSPFAKIGAATAAAFAAYRETPSEETAAALESALQTEQPLTLCVAYIRSLPDEFTD